MKPTSEQLKQENIMTNQELSSRLKAIAKKHNVQIGMVTDLADEFASCGTITESEIKEIDCEIGHMAHEFRCSQNDPTMWA